MKLLAPRRGWEKGRNPDRGESDHEGVEVMRAQENDPDVLLSKLYIILSFTD
jgi:hypothetical protein